VSLAPVILAAGASRRLGEPKALADLGGQSVLERLARALEGLSRTPLVITGYHHVEIQAHAARRTPEVEVILNPSWEEGRTSGVALAATRRPGEDLLVCPADVPAVSPALIESLAEEWHRRGAPPRGWLAPSVEVVPRQERRFGHPIILGAHLASLAGEQPADAPLRRLRDSAAPLLTLPTSELAILDDLDTPEDLRSIRERLQGDPPLR